MTRWGHCTECSVDVLVTDDERPRHDCGILIELYTDRCDICRREIPEGLGARLCEGCEKAGTEHAKHERIRREAEAEGVLRWRR